jgi:hypothetical protein
MLMSESEHKRNEGNIIMKFDISNNGVEVIEILAVVVIIALAFIFG